MGNIFNTRSEFDKREEQERIVGYRSKEDLLAVIGKYI